MQERLNERAQATIPSERTTGGSTLEVHSGSQAPVKSDGTQWEYVVNLADAGNSSIAVLYGVTINVMFVHSDTTPGDCTYVETALWVTDDWDNFNVITDAQQIRQFIGRRAWLQNGSQPPVQEVMYVKRVNLKRGQRCALYFRSDVAYGNVLTGRRLCYGYKFSQYKASVG